MNFEPFSIGLFNDGETVDTAHINPDLTLLVTSTNGVVDSRYAYETDHFIVIADAIRKKRNELPISVLQQQIVELEQQRNAMQAEIDMMKRGIVK